MIVCACGAEYALEQFRELPLVGTHLYPDPPVKLELRNCRCRSTIGIWTDRDGEPVPEEK